jgi:hypothetical protein
MPAWYQYPHHTEMTADLKRYGINTDLWWSNIQPWNLLPQLLDCYEPRCGRRRFNTLVHKQGVERRLEKYCRDIIREHPELAAEKE